MESIDNLLRELILAEDTETTKRIILTITDIAKDNMQTVVSLALRRIELGQFDGSKWSSLALTLLDNYKYPEEPGQILKALVEVDPDNGAYLNNYGVFLQYRQRIGEALEYYARAYATDYKAHGHDKATNFPAWKNLHLLAISIKA